MENVNGKMQTTKHHKDVFWTCFSNKLAGYLLMHNCVLIGVEQHRDKPNFRVYKFLKEDGKIFPIIEEYMRVYGGKR